MKFEFTEEQEALREVVRSFLRRHSGEASVRDAMASDDGWNRGTWEQMATQIGLQGLIIPVEYDGAGASVVELGIVMEEMGRALYCGPFLSTAVLGAAVLVETQDHESCSRYLPRIAAGEFIVTLAAAWSDEGCGSSPIRAMPDGSAWRLTGVERHVLDLAIADLVIVAASTPTGPGLFSIDPAEVARCAPVTTFDQTRRMGAISLINAPARLVAHGEAAARAVERTMSLANAALAAEQAGGTAAAVDMAVEYARYRVQFGRPIGSFQAIKHKCADMHVDLESARSAAYWALWCAAGEPETFPLAASAARAYCSDAFLRCAAQNIQVHGGIGFTWEHPAHLYYRRARSSEAILGNSRRHLDTVASLIGVS